MRQSQVPRINEFKKVSSAIYPAGALLSPQHTASQRGEEVKELRQSEVRAVCGEAQRRALNLFKTTC